MKQINPSIILMILGTAVSIHAQDKLIVPVVKEKLIPVDIADVKVGGEIGRRIDVTVTNNIHHLKVDNDFLSPFRKKDTGDEGFIGLGMLIDAVVKLAAYSHDEKVISLKNYLIDETIKVQEADGYSGNMIPGNRMWKLWDIHEMGYIIFGLISNYEHFGDKGSLAAARKTADYIIENWSSMPVDWEETTNIAVHVCVTGIDRTMLTLYKVTGDKRYLDFCLKQRNLQNWDPGIVIGRRSLAEGHIYAYMAACLAQLELYRLHPEEKLLEPTMKAIDFMTTENGMSIMGGTGQIEVWTDDQDGRGDIAETCATAYQIRVFENLLKLEGDSRYGDIMERTIFNALFAAQSPDGRQIRYYTPFEGNRVYFDRDTYCCPNNYRRIISELPSMVYYRAGEGVAINLYSSSTANIILEGGISVAIKQETDYPNSGNVVIRIDPSESSSFPLKLRIPSWCRNARISVNGKPSETNCTPGTFAVIERSWKFGDKVIINMPMEWRLVKGRQRQAGRVTVMRGPLVYCLNSLQDESIAHKDGTDVGRIVIDLESIEQETVANSAVRTCGTGCRLKAGNSKWALGNAGNISLTLTEFADPDGKCTYFRTPDLAGAVEDELTKLWDILEK